MSKVVGIKPLRDEKKAAILYAVAKLRDISLAADTLGLGKTTLYRKLKEYGVSFMMTPRGLRRSRRTLLKGSRKMAYDPKRLVLLLPPSTTPTARLCHSRPQALLGRKFRQELHQIRT